VVRKFGEVGGHIIRRVGEPLAGAAKPLAHTVQDLIGHHPVGAAVMGAVNKGLDYVHSGRAAAMADKVAKWGAGIAGGSG
jgi:hypothetical protein